MSFDSLADFVAMGGHGLYVWLAYGSTILVVVANVLSVGFARRRYFRQARALERRLAVGTPDQPGDQTGSPMEGIQ